MNVIEVFADVGCPFTHVGLRRFVARRAELGREDVRLHVRAWPLELVNGAPLDAGFIAEEVDDIRSGFDDSIFVHFRAERFPSSSIPAMTLAAAAYRVDVRTGEAVSLELRDLLFEQGVDISDPAVLGRLAQRHGVSVDLADDSAVRADHRLGQDRDVVGSPHFFTSSGDFFCPSLDVSRDASGHLRITADPEGFERFLASCLG